IGPAFAPFFPGKTILSGDENWGQADYVVKTAASSQASPLEPQNLQEVKTLLHTIRYDGMEQAWIFANDNPVKPEIVWNEQPVIFDNQIRLLATHAVVQDDRLDVFVKWQLVQSVNGRFNVQIRLLDVAGQPWSQVEMPLLNETYFYPQNWQADEQPVWRYPLSLPPGLPPAHYRIEVSLFATGTGAQLPVFAENGRFAGVVYPLTELFLEPSPLLQTEPLNLTTNPQPMLNEKLLFLGQANVPETVLTAATFSFDLFWQSTAVLSANLQIQLMADEMILATLPLSRFNSGAWQVGQVIQEKYQILVPAELAAAEYDFWLELLDENGRPLDSPSILLGILNIVSPDRLFTLPDDIDQPLLLYFDELANLRGYDFPNQTAVPGDPIQLTLYWQIERQPAEILSTFVHLLGPNGGVVVQGDQWLSGLPSTTWAAGQVIIDEYAIKLPDDAPLGNYQVIVGLYPPATGVRLPIFTADGQLLADDQFILPLPLEVIAP
ncbi:MAG: hypothetical protein GY805_34570, partial [Chloroflexi bacterium]|nr:hypothetical protein [Chloroflexota bacterium]